MLRCRLVTLISIYHITKVISNILSPHISTRKPSQSSMVPDSRMVAGGGMVPGGEMVDHISG